MNGPLGVVIVTHNSDDVIEACLDSLAASHGVTLKVAVVDNGSSDGTTTRVAAWKQRNTTLSLSLILQANLGFAGGVNRGLTALLADPSIDNFWVLNPDCRVLPDTARAFCETIDRTEAYALIGGRLIYEEHPDIVQSDGGTVNHRTGAVRQLGRDGHPDTTPMPDAATLDFVSGASMVASRGFIEQAGLMHEDYFLFYEEVDWAFCRGTLPLAIAPGAIVLHRGGSSTGSGGIAKHASPLAFYFNYRNRVRFARRHLGGASLTLYITALLQATRLIPKDAWPQIEALLRGLFQLGPPASVAARFADPTVARIAFGPTKTTT